MTRDDIAGIGDARPMDPLGHAIDIPVLGLVTRFNTNSRDVLALIVDAFGAWSRLPPQFAETAAPRATVSVIVREGSEHTVGRSPITHSCPDALQVVARSSMSVGISDPLRSAATAHVTSELVADRDHFRDEMLQAITLALVSSYDRHFLHAAAIASGNRAILLAAPSGTGKSTLAYLAQRSGLDVMSEDRVWIQQSPALRVWGWPVRLHLRPESAAHFPELNGAAMGAHGAGPLRHVVDIATGANVIPRFCADDVVVCLLTRGDSAPSLERVEAGELVEALHRDLASGFDRHADRHEPAMRAIAKGGGWRLRLSGNPHEALPLLKQMLAST